MKAFIKKKHESRLKRELIILSNRFRYYKFFLTNNEFPNQKMCNKIIHINFTLFSLKEENSFGLLSALSPFVVCSFF